MTHTVSTPVQDDASVSRRSFLQIGALAGGGLVAGFYLPAVTRLTPLFAAEQKVLQPNVFVRVTPDDWITVTIGHTEMGQGVSTIIPMMVAEELDADWSRVRWEQAPTAPAFAHPMLHSQLTGGSLTTMAQFMPQRQAGAALRAVLIAAAAKRWSVAAASLKTDSGRVIDAVGKRSATYGELASEAVGIPVPEKLTLKERKDFRIIGKPMRRLDGASKVDGSAKFAIDIDRPGLLTAVVAHPPCFGGKARGVDASKAKAVPGVLGVYELPTGVAVVGKDFWSAKKGRDALVVDWDPALGERASSQTQAAYYAKLLDAPGTRAHAIGDMAAANKSAAKTLSSDYHFPYMTHAPMEPLGATVELRADATEIWASTQWPEGNQRVAAALLGLKPEQVIVNTTITGGGFGRRSYPGHDFVREAVQVAKAARALNAPIKLIWTREDDIRGGAYRPTAATRLTATLDRRGQISSFSQRLVVQSIGATTPFKDLIVKDGVDHLSVEGSASELPYAVPNMHVDLHTPDSGVPVTWMRSVGHSFNAYAVETFIDELAKAAAKDPYQFRRALLSTKPRELAVLDAVAKRAQWSVKAAAGVHRGIAFHSSYGSHVASVVEVSVSPKRELKVHRVVIGIDCGIAINPDLVVAQMESSVVFALTSTYFGEITLRKGVVEQSNFDDYPLLRMYQTPRIETIVIDSDQKPGGAGEPGVPPVGAALANAIFAATGEPMRSLPLKHHFQIA